MNRYRKIILLSLKIGIGSSLSLYAAQKLGLNYAVSAGTITLLSLMNSKWETIKLSGSRIASFLITVLAGWLLFKRQKNKTVRIKPPPELSVRRLCNAGIHAEMGCRYFEKRTEAECGAYLALSAVASFP